MPHRTATTQIHNERHAAVSGVECASSGLAAMFADKAASAGGHGAAAASGSLPAGTSQQLRESALQRIHNRQLLQRMCQCVNIRPDAGAPSRWRVSQMILALRAIDTPPLAALSSAASLASWLTTHRKPTSDDEFSDVQTSVLPVSQAVVQSDIGAFTQVRRRKGHDAPALISSSTIGSVPNARSMVLFSRSVVLAINSTKLMSKAKLEQAVTDILARFLPLPTASSASASQPTPWGLKMSRDQAVRLAMLEISEDHHLDRRRNSTTAARSVEALLPHLAISEPEGPSLAIQIVPTLLSGVMSTYAKWDDSRQSWCNIDGEVVDVQLLFRSVLSFWWRQYLALRASSRAKSSAHIDQQTFHQAAQHHIIYLASVVVLVQRDCALGLLQQHWDAVWNPVLLMALALMSILDAFDRLSVGRRSAEHSGIKLFLRCAPPEVLEAVCAIEQHDGVRFHLATSQQAAITWGHSRDADESVSFQCALEAVDVAFNQISLSDREEQATSKTCVSQPAVARKLLPAASSRFSVLQLSDSEPELLESPLPLPPSSVRPPPPEVLSVRFHFFSCLFAWCPSYDPAEEAKLLKGADASAYEAARNRAISSELSAAGLGWRHIAEVLAWSPEVDWGQVLELTQMSSRRELLLLFGFDVQTAQWLWSDIVASNPARFESLMQQHMERLGWGWRYVARCFPISPDQRQLLLQLILAKRFVNSDNPDAPSETVRQLVDKYGSVLRVERFDWSIDAKASPAEPEDPTLILLAQWRGAEKTCRERLYRHRNDWKAWQNSKIHLQHNLPVLCINVTSKLRILAIKRDKWTRFVHFVTPEVEPEHSAQDEYFDRVDPTMLAYVEAGHKGQAQGMSLYDFNLTKIDLLQMINIDSLSGWEDEGVSPPAAASPRAASVAAAAVLAAATAAAAAAAAPSASPAAAAASASFTPVIPYQPKVAPSQVYTGKYAVNSQVRAPWPLKKNGSLFGAVITKKNDNKGTRKTTYSIRFKPPYNNIEDNVAEDLICS